MPGRKPKPPRLVQRRDGWWVVKDRARYIRTGCKGRSEAAVQRAEEKLADYIGGKHNPAIGESNPDKLPIADVLAFYETLKAPPESEFDKHRLDRHDELVARLETLNEFLGDRFVADIKAQICRDYVAWRMGTLDKRKREFPPARPRTVASETARRELEDLRSAVNAYHAEHTLRVVPKITLPEKSSPRARWLKRREVARLLGAALGFVWDSERNGWARDETGRLRRRNRRIRSQREPAARFILVGIYSGRREQTIRRTLWMASTAAPWFDLERMIYHGRGEKERRTKKRRPPAAIAYRLRPHLLRWQRLDEASAAALGRPIITVIHKANGDPLKQKIRKSWSGILQDAALGPDVLRHTLKHTAGTWLMHSGTDLWKAAGFLGITVETLEQTYGHHHPDFQDEAASAFGGRR